MKRVIFPFQTSGYALAAPKLMGLLYFLHPCNPLTPPTSLSLCQLVGGTFLPHSSLPLWLEPSAFGPKHYTSMLNIFLSCRSVSIFVSNVAFLLLPPTNPTHTQPFFKLLMSKCKLIFSQGETAALFPYIPYFV